ncbi:MAG: hypothetical protein IT353_21980 [Gemmatimonadaceae bacterium]|nr:hypothetical protein [Gemmatimonadaceae bacterium]
MAKGNWVDRGDTVEYTLSRVLGHVMVRPSDDPALVEHVQAIRGMVEADSTEVHVAGYLRSVEASLGREESDPVLRRMLAIALWHIVKVAQVRDESAREIAALRAAMPPSRRLSEQLRDAILSAPDVPPVSGGDRAD